MNQIQLATSAALAVTATAGFLSYAALSPQSQIFGATLIANRSPNEIALTYDDGPNPDATPRLLETLARYDVHATFFLIGRFVRQCPALVREIASAGHLIGNHSMTHPRLPFQSNARILQELTECNAVLEDTLGVPVRYFRAPYGNRRPFVLSTARRLGLIPVQWNIMCGDWNPVTAETIYNRAISGIVRNQHRGYGSNIVLHDGGDKSLGQPRIPSVEATTLLLKKYASQPAIKFVTVDSWT